MLPLRLILRALAILGLFWLHLLVYGFGWLGLLLSGAGRARRQALQGATLVELLRGLGATFIKIGQFMSTRGDLLPPHLLAALQELQDRVGPFPYVEVRRILQAELGRPPEEEFAELDPYPVASASVAQVHRGVLADGRVVAVKVLRPRIEHTVSFDLMILRGFARMLALVPAVRALGPVAVVDEFGHALRQQLDFTIEAENNRRFAESFATDATVGVPRLVEELCSKRVLCMEYVVGAKILGETWDPPRAELLARAGFRMLLKMIFLDGFVHADLHPGNLLVTSADGGDRIMLLDVGLVARLSGAHRGALAALLAAWATQDAGRICQIMLALAPGPPERDPAPLRAAVEDLLARYRTVALAEVQLGAVLLEITRLMRRHRVSLEPALTMIIVAIGVVEGVGRQLAPHLDLAREALAFFATLSPEQRAAFA